MKTRKIISYIGAFVAFVTTSYLVYGAVTPAQDVSGNDQCFYRIEGTGATNASYDSLWQNIACSTSIDFAALSVPDGTFFIKLKGFDQNVLGVDKVFSDGTSVSKKNKYDIQTFGPYKVDTHAPKCLLKEVRFKAGESNNQYYNSGSVFYKQASDAQGKFELVIEVDEISSGTNTSGIQKVEFPTLLGATPSTQSFSSLSWTGKTTVTGLYEWSGVQTSTGDILNNTSRQYCFDFAGNGVALSSDASTKVIFEDGNQVHTGVTTLLLTPDSAAPTVNGVALNNISNGFSFQSGNDGLGSILNIYDSTTANSKYFAALDTRKLIIPDFKDLDSGLKSFKVNIETAVDKTTVSTYIQALSDKNTKFTTLANTGIVHDFSKVKTNDDYNINGYRPYSWDIKNLDISGADLSAIWNNKICDMVGNCVTIDTPDFRIVANEPVIATNTSIADISKIGSKHNLDLAYSGSDINMRSNYADTHQTEVRFRDKFGNEITPVNGVKNIDLAIKYDNTLGCDQIYSAGAGDCVDFLFKKSIAGVLVGATHAVSETKNFGFVLTSGNDFYGDLSIEMKSAIPTKNEYKTLAGLGIYGASSAILQIKNLGIEPKKLVTYSGVGERTNLEMANSSTNQPSYKWNPIINFNSIDDIYPTVEGQEKNMNLANVVHDNTGLPAYQLQSHFGTNNPFLQFQSIYLQNGNIGATHYIDNYTVFSGATTGSGYINYTAGDTMKVTPKTIGGISGSNTNIAFFSTLEYTLGGKFAILPSLQTGFASYGPHVPGDFTNTPSYESKSKVTLSEVDIRGISQTKNIGGPGVTTDGKFVDISNITLFDLKTDINKNISAILAGVDKNEGVVGSAYTLGNLTIFPNSATSGKNLQNGQVLYFKDTNVTIDCATSICSVSGKKTLIIENGNLFIKSNMKYANDASILGIILIGNTANGSKSQVRISEDITNGVGVIYSEGPVISVTAGNTDIYNGASPSNSSLVNQLYWKGSFASKNTVGGSIKDAQGVCPYGTPDYKKPSCTIQKAQGYDLIYLRRYARVATSYYTGVLTDPMGDGKIPTNIDKAPVKISGGDTYAITTGIKAPGTLPKPIKNNLNAPLILEYDSRIQTNPPLGFSK